MTEKPSNSGTEKTNAPQAALEWSSPAAFILVAAGTAIGLGNLWRFPFLAGQYGGGAFIFVYLCTVLLIGVPIIIAELCIGRRGRGSPEHAVRRISRDEGANRAWNVIGGLSVFIPIVGIGYYSVVAGWVTDYAFHFIAGDGLSGEGEAEAASRFNAMLASPNRLLISHSVFMAGVILILCAGLRGGVERMAKILMPLLFILISGLALYAIFTGDIAQAAGFLLRPDFSKLTTDGIIAAVGQAFFSLAIGLGALVTFGAYLPQNVSITRTAAGIAIADTAIAFIAGFAIFPIVFAYNIDPASGPGLVFITMPAAFGAMPSGYWIGAAFFVLLFAAAFTTAVGTLEAAVAWGQRKGLSRTLASIMAGAGSWLIGIVTALSFNLWSDFRPLSFIPALSAKGIFDLLDYLIATLLLPLNALIMTLFVGWVMSRQSTKEEIAATPFIFSVWRILIRLAAPAAIIVIMISSIWKSS